MYYMNPYMYIYIVNHGTCAVRVVIFIHNAHLVCLYLFSAPVGLTVTVINVTTTSVLLSWQSLTGNDTGGSPIIGYIITYYYTAGSEKNV